MGQTFYRFSISSLLISLVSLVIFPSCLIKGDGHNVEINGIYQGQVLPFDGPAYEKYWNKNCPKLDIKITVSEGVADVLINDIYLDYEPDPDWVKTHQMTSILYEGWKFDLQDAWKPGQSQLEEMAFDGLCDADIDNYSPIKDVGLLMSPTTGAAGEITGENINGPLVYGARCSNGTLVPLCFYYIKIPKVE
jgi:hypothetical protein